MTLGLYLQKNHKTYLIFDFDETLVKLMLPWEKWEEKIQDKLLEWNKSIYKDYKDGKITLSNLINNYVLEYGKEAKRLIAQNAIDFETKYLKDYIPNKKLLAFIKRAKQYKMFIWSSNARPTVNKVLKEFKITNLFEKIVSNQDVKLLKPYPDGFNKIYNPKIPKNKYLIVGDSDIDKKAAKQVKVDFFLIDYFRG